MKSEAEIRRMLAEVESKLAAQEQEGMAKGWPVLFWDRNCVVREVLRKVLGLRYKPFCAADMMAGW